MNCRVGGNKCLDQTVCSHNLYSSYSLFLHPGISILLNMGVVDTLTPFLLNITQPQRSLQLPHLCVSWKPILSPEVAEKPVQRGPLSRCQ